MSYALGLGYDVEVDIPLVGRKVVSFDLDKVAEDASEALIKSSWPKIEQRARTAMPAFVNQAIDLARPAIREERDLAIKKATKTVVVAGAAAAAVLLLAWWLSSPRSAATSKARA